MRNSNTFKLLIFTRAHTNDSTRLTIYARITVNGKRAEISLKRYTTVNDWDDKLGRIKGNTQKAKLLNSYLDEVYASIMDAHKVLLREDVTITAQAIKARYLGQDEGHKTLLDIVKYHNTTQHLLLKPGTMKNYHSTERYIHKFLNEQLNLPDIQLKRLNYRFISDFEHYLRSYTPKVPRKTCSNNGTMKHLERLMKMLNLAVKLEWVAQDPFKNYKLRFEKTERSYLTKRELSLIEETTFNGTGYERVKDVFLFSCYTGLSYIDVKQLTTEQIHIGIDGNLWIYTKREKTNETVKIPLLTKAKAILEKYSEESEKVLEESALPVYSNQKMNQYLKVITKACGIRKRVTFHTARHTFATTITLSNGVPIETVSKMLGHSKLTTTQIYARVLEQKVGEDMQMLMAKLESQEK
ncbi:transposase [Croceivirga lutea]|uniref:site-specific integrase n=1 Tax=Croceivirga lutea TaxID=1775167 RepID=UPI00163B22FF|nr:site-specific integrase [Croceivirga lutea]GGG57212.1 transposase [Croceivirga lutea]